MIWLKDAKYLEDYTVFVQFNNGLEKVLDLEEYIKAKPNNTIFAELKELKKFRQMVYSKDLDTIVWQNGADIAPERLYELATK